MSQCDPYACADAEDEGEAGLTRYSVAEKRSLVEEV